MNPETHSTDQQTGGPKSRRTDDVDQHSLDDLAAADAAPEDLDESHPKRRQELLLDQGVEETFPASDPVSVKRIT